VGSGVVFRRIGGRIIPILKKAGRDVKNTPKAFGLSAAKAEASKSAMRSKLAGSDLSRTQSFSTDRRAMAGTLNRKANEMARQAKDTISRPLSGNLFTRKQERLIRAKSVTDLRQKRDVFRSNANRLMGNFGTMNDELLSKSQALSRANKKSREAKRDLLKAKSGVRGLGILGASAGATGAAVYSVSGKKKRK